MKELAQNLGSAFGRLINETMIPLVAKILEVMDEKGLIDLPLRVNGLEVKVTPVSPLAQAQSMEEVNAIIQFTQLMQSGQFGQDGALAIKTDAAVDYIADKMGVPAAVRNDTTERAVLMEEMQAKQEAAMAAQVSAQATIAAAQGSDDQQLLEAINAG
jgi:hypothetical protein